jgi:hypothetical protein
MLMNLGPKRVPAVFIWCGLNYLAECKDQGFGDLGRCHHLGLHLAIDQRKDSLVEDVRNPSDY